MDFYIYVMKIHFYMRAAAKKGTLYQDLRLRNGVKMLLENKAIWQCEIEFRTDPDHLKLTKEATIKI